MTVRERLGGDRSAALPLLWDARRRFGSQASLARAVGTDDGLIAKLLYADRKPGRSLGVRLRDRAGVPIEAWDEPLLPDVEVIPSDWRDLAESRSADSGEHVSLESESSADESAAVESTGT